MPTADESGSTATGTRRALALLSRHMRAVGLLAYAAGVVWFALHASPGFNRQTYISENALMPGGAENAYTSPKHDAIFQEIYDGLTLHGATTKERLTSHVEATLRGWRIEVQRQAFTYSDPYLDENLTGTNVYAILRAPRSDGSEAMVLTAPLWSSQYKGEINTMGMAVALTLVRVLQRTSFWARDIIVVFADRGAVGMRMWIMSYLDVLGENAEADPLAFYSGAIQFGLNMDFGNATAFGQLALFPEGTNGQMPNLDLINVVESSARYRGVATQLYRRQLDGDVTAGNYATAAYIKALKTMLTMMKNQAMGSPTGEHGVFLRYRIDMITLSSVRGAQGWVKPAQIIGTVEATMRSLNNALEHLHQSFSYYLLFGESRFISIGMYYPPFILMSIGMLAIMIWYETSELKRQHTLIAEPTVEVDGKRYVRGYTPSLGQRLLVQPFYVLIVALGAGVVQYHLPIMRKMVISEPNVMQLLIAFEKQSGWLVRKSLQSGAFDIYLSLLLAMAAAKIGAAWMRSNLPSSASSRPTAALILRCYLGLAISAALLTASILNFSLAFFLALALSPLVLCVRAGTSAFIRPFAFLAVLAASPLAYAFVIALWEHCGAKDCVALVQNVTEKWTPAAWMASVEVKNEDYVDYILTLMETFVGGIALVSRTTWSSFYTLYTAQDWLTEVGLVMNRVFMAHILVDSWLYRFMHAVWWPAVIALWATLEA